jgi:superfamily II DNA/RNA helicase
MKIVETPIAVSLEQPHDSRYFELLNEYFTASERNGRASSIEEKKKMMAIKEEMAALCNRNPRKLDALTAVVSQVRERREKAALITKSNVIASDLAGFLEERFGSHAILNITNQDSVHDVNHILDKFGKLPESTVLILTDSANMGLDLTAANHLIHYDYPQKFTDMIQRNNRISRQTSKHSDAAIYYLITTGRIDELEFLQSKNT